MNINETYHDGWYVYSSCRQKMFDNIVLVYYDLSFSMNVRIYIKIFNGYKFIAFCVCYWWVNQKKKVMCRLAISTLILMLYCITSTGKFCFLHECNQIITLKILAILTWNQSHDCFKYLFVEDLLKCILWN